MKTDLASLGITNPSTIHHNLTAGRLVEEAVRKSEGHLSRHGALIVDTGKYTGRSPNDKFTVKDGETADTVWWGKVNRPIEAAVFDKLLEKTVKYYNGRPEVFVQDCYAGTDPEYRMPVRIVNECAWHNLFARNMFVRIEDKDLEGFQPEFTVLHAPFNEAAGADDGVNSEAYVLVNFAKKLVLIGGTKYAGEIKKSIFSVMNYILPGKGVLPMHCSSNIGEGGDSALFFGLSGTGKTTLSADPHRKLIGDDEHGWSDAGIFNFQGGCYAKTIGLTEGEE
ncbi:MAG: phosphoenolpyruvate carboxykinase (ATP), partial [Planctomycetes bacterium]|nr:phosphoenolpyruvate carboxykinase (ATP) [Planctomycetota bacterium]